MFILFIYESHRERERERQRPRQREPDLGLDPGTPGSRPGPKAGAKPLSHPGIPDTGPAERRDSIFQRHDAIIISGTEMAKQIQKEIQRGVESWISLGNRRPHLSIILVGDNPASHTYVRKKIRAASAVGICSEIILKPKDVSQEELLDITDQLNMDPRVSGILVQLPLPGDATVTIAHRYTPKEQLKIHTQLADIIIVAAGIPKLITSDMVKEGAAVIDVGINYVHDPVTGKTKLVGDVDFEAVKKKASFITPVPGGVGPMTVAMLLKNTLLAAKKLIY
ncbi:bifunctional methylenetetrahydrofolate dehydrogenase/cyclohydrolase 2, mitochondrial isoform X12 [Canis aureus]